MRHGRANRDIILIGHEGHPEVEGTMGRYFSKDGKIYLVQDLEEAMEVSVSQPENLAYVTQTTLSVDETKDIINELTRKFPKITGSKKRRYLLCNPKQTRCCQATSS
jgi:4-hydroxy-3-methylbut-2-enyl diphosphate reductase